jgi:hypothetical protein
MPDGAGITRQSAAVTKSEAPAGLRWQSPNARCATVVGKRRRSAGTIAASRSLRHAVRASRAARDAATQAANPSSVRVRKLRASETGQIRDNFRQTQPCNGRMALPARKVDRSTSRFTVNKI